MVRSKRLWACTVALALSICSMQSPVCATSMDVKDYDGNGTLNVIDVLYAKNETMYPDQYETLGKYKLQYSLNFRSGAGVEYSSYGMVPQGAIIDVIDTAYDKVGILWGKYQYEGQFGWTSLKYTDRVATSQDELTQRVLDTKECVLGIQSPQYETVVDDGTFHIGEDGSFVDVSGNVIYTPNTPLLDTDLFANYYEQALLDVQNMSLEEKVGQMFIVGCYPSASDNLTSITDYHVGGIITYSYNFQNKTVKSVKSEIQSYQDASKVPLIVAVDEEGGSIVRVSAYSQFRSTPFLSAQRLYANGGLTAIYNDTVEKAQLLNSLGINLNFAPVADVSTSTSDYIYYRTFGKDASKTAEYITTCVQAYNSQNFSCTLKHFPGYGNNLNTHTGISIDKRSKESFYSSDFLPFMAGIAEGVPFIMVSHNIVTSFDADVPASISPEVHRVLREDLGYTGLVITDDLYMDAIKDYTGTTNACVYAIQAGNDMLVTGSYVSGYNAVLNAVKNGTLSEYRIDESVIRILAYKYCYGLM